MSGMHVLDLAVVCSFVFFVLALSPDDQMSSLHVLHSSSVPHLRLSEVNPDQTKLDWTGLGGSGRMVCGLDPSDFS